MTTISEHSWEFQTAGAPLRIEAGIYAVEDSDSQNRGYYLHIRIRGLANPCLGGRRYYVGFETHNPALMPARDKIVASMQDRLRDSLVGHKLETSYRIPSSGRPDTEFHSNSADDIVLKLNFNYSIAGLRQVGYQPATIPQLQALMGDIVATIDTVKPDVEALISENTGKQPDPEDDDQVRQYRDGYKEREGFALGRRRVQLAEDLGYPYAAPSKIGRS